LQRSGLPPGVAALVDQISADKVSLSLVNTSDAMRTVVIQAGSFREHRFDRAMLVGEAGEDLATVGVDSEWVEIWLDPQAVARLRFDVSRFANDPSYETPWSPRTSWPPVITGRTASP
jgi:hypothetical protein